MSSTTRLARTRSRESLVRILLAAATAIILFAPPASAEDSAPTAGSVPTGRSEVPSGDAGRPAAADVTANPTDTALPHTGSSTTALLIRVAAVSLLGGPVLVAVARRRVTVADP